MDKSQLTITILVIVLAIVCGYIALDKTDFCKQARNESNYTGYNLGFNKGFEKGYNNGTNDLIVIMNQRNTFPDLDFQTGEFSWKTINQMCEEIKK